MDLGVVLVRDPRYVWHRRLVVLARHALELRAEGEADAAKEVLSLDGGWRCEAVVVSAAHPHAVRLSELRSGREMLVDTGSKGKRQMWAELFANARASAAAVPSARQSAPTTALQAAERVDSLQLSQKAAEMLAPVAGQLMRGEDVEVLLAEHRDSLLTDARTVADVAAALVLSGVLEPLFACDCRKERDAEHYASDQIFRVKRQEVLSQVIAAPSTTALPELSVESPAAAHRARNRRVRRLLAWSEDEACLQLLQQLDRADNGLTGTQVVQTLLQGGVFNVPTAVGLCSRMLQDEVIRLMNADVSEEPSFTMDDSTTYAKVTGDEIAQLTLVENEPLATPCLSQDEVAGMEERLVEMKRRHDTLFRILCAVCVLMAIDTWMSSAFTTSLKAGASIALLFMFMVRDGTATVAINFRDASGAQQLGGVVTAGFMSGTREGPSMRGVADADCAPSTAGKMTSKPSDATIFGSQAGAASTSPGAVHPALTTAMMTTAPEVQRAGVLSSVDQAKVLSFRQAIAQSSNVPIDETQVFSDIYLLSVMSVKDRAFRYAVVKMAKIIDWRRSYGMERLTLASVDAEVKARLASGNMYWYGYDFQNRPILWVRAHLKNWSNMATSREAEVRAHVFLIDLCCRELMPTDCTTFTIVSDASKISMSMVDLRLMHALVDTCVANFPDRIGMVHAGPLNRLLKYLTTVLWPFLPVRLRSKVALMRDCATELSKHMRFDLIPTYMGGPAEHELNARGDPAQLDIPFMLEAQKRRMQALSAGDK